MGFSKELKNEFETAVVNEPSVFEPLKFYCTWQRCPDTLLTMGINFCDFLFVSMVDGRVETWKK